MSLVRTLGTASRGMEFLWFVWLDFEPPPNFSGIRFYITKFVAFIQKTNLTGLNNLLMKILATKDVVEKEGDSLLRNYYLGLFAWPDLLNTL